LSNKVTQYVGKHLLSVIPFWLVAKEQHNRIGVCAGSSNHWQATIEAKTKNLSASFSLVIQSSV